jgi:hypothetical protein
MCSFYVRKLRAQLFCAYILGLYFTGARLLALKLHIERWWNSAWVSIYNFNYLTNKFSDLFENAQKASPGECFEASKKDGENVEERRGN